MAINTEDKRRSALRTTLPKPKGSIAAADRRHAAHLYRGIATAAPAVSKSGGLGTRVGVGVF